MRCGAVEVGTAELLEILLERRIGLLGSRQIPGLQGLSQDAKSLGDGVTLLSRSRAGTLRASPMVMVVAVMGLAGALLNVLLNRGIGLLGRGKIPSLESLPQRTESLGQRTIALQSARSVLRQDAEILLRLSQIAVLQILTQLLEFTLELLEAVGFIGGLVETARRDT